MRIKLRAKPWYSGNLYGEEFKDGQSEGHISQHLFHVLTVVSGLEPEYIPDEVLPCPHCKEMSNTIIELQLEVARLKDKKQKSEK